MENQVDPIAGDLLFIMRYRKPGLEYKLIPAPRIGGQSGLEKARKIRAHHLIGVFVEQGRLIGICKQAVSGTISGVDHDRDRVDYLFEHAFSRRTLDRCRFADLCMFAFGFRCTLAQRHAFLAFCQQRQRATAKLNMRNRALQEICGTGIKGSKSAFTVLMRGDDDCRHLACTGHHPDFSDKFRAVHLRHPIIYHHQIDLVVAQPMQSLYRVSVCDSGISFPH